MFIIFWVASMCSCVYFVHSADATAAVLLRWWLLNATTVKFLNSKQEINASFDAGGQTIELRTSVTWCWNTNESSSTTPAGWNCKFSVAFFALQQYFTGFFVQFESHSSAEDSFLSFDTHRICSKSLDTFRRIERCFAVTPTMHASISVIRAHRQIGFSKLEFSITTKKQLGFKKI